MTNYMKELLVGNTGFVGGNLLLSHTFNNSCHSTDIGKYFGFNPDICIYAGIPASMILANTHPEEDYKIMINARTNIRQINPRNLVLISTIAVYDDSRLKDEDAFIDINALSTYGKNRLYLENWVKEDYENVLIIRLPALYGKGLKKNFLYDLHTYTPYMLKVDKYEELSKESELVSKGYSFSSNGFYVINHNVDEQLLKKFFMDNAFNALSFTDSRSKFQFYSLKRLWKDIQIGLSNNLSKMNLCTPPLSALDVYEIVTGNRDWKNELSISPYDYDMRTKYNDLFNNKEGYTCTIDEEMKDIYKFMNSWK